MDTRTPIQSAVIAAVAASGGMWSVYHREGLEPGFQLWDSYAKYDDAVAATNDHIEAFVAFIPYRIQPSWMA